MTDRNRHLALVCLALLCIVPNIAPALTVYDMCKAVDRGMTISDVRLKKKSGGKSGGPKLLSRVFGGMSTTTGSRKPAFRGRSFPVMHRST